MSFALSCPNCGRRFVGEFSFRGEYHPRPQANSPWQQWSDYVFCRDNPAGPSVEWWYHRSGCQRWFMVRRDTTNNADRQSFWFAERERFVNRQGQREDE